MSCNYCGFNYFMTLCSLCNQKYYCGYCLYLAGSCYICCQKHVLNVILINI